MSKSLTKKFYLQYTPKVAQDLLGCFLVRTKGNKIIRGVITETEAYRGQYDLACHASKGKTERTAVMFGEPGHAYVYLVYGMHWMLNLVTEEKDFPAAVLIRGVDLISHRNFENSYARGLKRTYTRINAENVLKKLDGPGKLTKEFAIDKKLNGASLLKKDRLWIEEGNIKKKKIQKSKRIGVDYAGHCREWKWNYRLGSS